MKSRYWRLVGILTVLALVLAACGSGEDTPESTDAPNSTEAPETTAGGGGDTDMSDLGLPVIDPLDVDPDVSIGIAGSSTVFPLSTAIQTLWEDEGGPSYSIDSIGSGGGFERFCVEGASDISNASRPIKDEEVASCQEIGREPIEIRVGTDALSVVVSPGNTFAAELTLEEIALAFSLPAGSTWDEVNPAFPAHPIAAFSPGADSGTFDYFNEEIFPEQLENDEESPILSGGAQIVGEDDNVTVQGVANDGCSEGDVSTTCAIGYFGYAYFQENADILVAVSVDGGDGPVLPGDESVNEGTYPLARPLFMYADAGVIGEKPQVAEWIAFYLNRVNEVIGDVGYFPAPQEDLQAAADAVKAAAGW